ncbi:MAG: hypothetical protein ABI168_10155 [Ginsengibacter sp.]
MKNKLFFISLIVISLSSCVTSLYPITENEKDIVFKSEFLGHWKDSDGNSEYVVNPAGDTSGKYYKVMTLDYHSDRTDTSNFLVALVNLNDHYFLDCVPDTSQNIYSSSNNASRGFLIPSHLIIKVFSFSNNSINLSAIDNDKLMSLLKSKKIRIRHEDIDSDNILLSEKPVVLQQKLLQLEDFPLVYKRDSIIRVK